MKRLAAVKEACGMFFGKEWSTQEKILVIVNCILAGVVLGILFGPRKGNVTVGSYNGNAGLEEAGFEDDGWLDEED